MRIYIQRAIIVLTIVTVMITAIGQPRTTYAVTGKDVPIDTMFNWHNIQQQTKDFVLNGLAWSVAKALVQQMTTSIVNWINTGFEGSPAFLSDPQGFFLDVGDQLTGEFIANTGALQGLCSPWNIDIRLALGLGQTRTRSERYTCTLSSIIGNAKNATINGYSIEGFTSGDFSQGGWPAFISLTSEPQNNPYGAYLQAKSDLEGQILGKQTDVNNDLTRGGGFMSWEKCETKITDANKSVTASQLGLSQQDMVELNNTGKVSSNSGKYRAVKDETTGYTDYQTCSVQTPGSVINASLNKSLGSGIDQLNLADSINEITSALFAQLITQVVTRGLGGSTQRSSGNTQSYIDQIYSESQGSSQYSATAQNIHNSYSPYIADAETTQSMYQQAVSAFQVARNDFSIAQGCYQNLTISGTPANKTIAQSKLDEIQNILVGQLAPAATPYQNKLDQADTAVTAMQANIDATRSISSAAQAKAAGAALETFINTQVPTLQQNRQTADTDLTAAQASATQFDTIAKNYIQQCQALK